LILMSTMSRSRVDDSVWWLRCISLLSKPLVYVVCSVCDCCLMHRTVVLWTVVV
jgi:hypothetical protein